MRFSVMIFMTSRTVAGGLDGAHVTGQLIDRLSADFFATLGVLRDVNLIGCAIVRLTGLSPLGL